MNQAEQQALQMVQNLGHFCSVHKLPVLCVVGLPDSNSIARSVYGQTKMNREIFREQINDLLNKEGN